MESLSCGFELEFEGLDIDDEDDAPEIFNNFNDYGDVTDDGSLNDGGFELVSPVWDEADFLGGNSAEADLMWNEIFFTAQHTGCYVGKYAGMHVHVSHLDLGDCEIDAIDKFIYEQREFVSKIARRKANTWCEAYRNSTEEIAKRRSDTKDIQLNISRHKTLEFRMFLGVTDVKAFYRNMQFALALCRHAHEISGEITLDGFRAYVTLNKERYFELFKHI